MANIGLSSYLYGELTITAGKATYAAPAKLAGAIECKVAPEANSAELYADDTLVESDYSIPKGTLTIGIDDDDDSVFGPLLGKTEGTYTPTGENKTPVTTYTSSINDQSKFVGFGYVTAKSGGKYKVRFFKKVKFKPFDSDSKTKGDKLEYTTPSVEGVFSTLEDGSYKEEATFEGTTARVDAIAYLKSLFVAATSVA